MQLLYKINTITDYHYDLYNSRREIKMSEEKKELINEELNDEKKKT